MMVDRNKTSYHYVEEEVKLIYQQICNTYSPLLTVFCEQMKKEITT
jgi:hypothetical protein